MEQQKQITDTPQEESIFNDVHIDTRGYDKHIRNARIMLYIIPGLQLIPIFFFDEADEFIYQLSVAIQVFLALAFAGIAYWTKYQPYAALVTAMVFYLAIIIAVMILDPTSIVKGILIKIIIIALLARGIRNAREAQELKKTFNR